MHFWGSNIVLACDQFSPRTISRKCIVTSFFVYNVMCWSNNISTGENWSYASTILKILKWYQNIFWIWCTQLARRTYYSNVLMFVHGYMTLHSTKVTYNMFSFQILHDEFIGIILTQHCLYWYTFYIIVRNSLRFPGIFNDFSWQV